MDLTCPSWFGDSCEQPCADGVTPAQWLEWLWAWHRGEVWAGPGNPPDRVEGIMTAGCQAQLDVWMTFLGQRDALTKLRAADAAIRHRLTAAAHGNVARNPKLDDLRPVGIVLAAGVEIDLIEMAISRKHDRRIKPSNPPLAWVDLFGRVADLYARGVLGPKLVSKWQARLVNPASTTDDSPTLRRAMDEIFRRRFVRGLTIATS